MNIDAGFESTVRKVAINCFDIIFINYLRHKKRYLIRFTACSQQPYFAIRIFSE
jgi:hypothetical protein